jgi:DNA polymerase-1
MIAVDHWCEHDSAGDARLIMQVHDELVLEVREAAVAPVTAAVRSLMVAAGADTLKVPLGVGIGAGANWDEAH